MSQKASPEPNMLAPVKIPWYRRFSTEQAEVIAKDLEISESQLTPAQAVRWLDMLVADRLQQANVNPTSPKPPLEDEPVLRPAENDDPEVPFVLGCPQPGKKRLEWRAGTLPENFDLSAADEQQLVEAFKPSEVWRGEKPPPKAQAAARKLVGRKRGEVREVLSPVAWDELNVS